MPRKKDIWLILAVLAGALVLLLISRLIPKKSLDERTADVTIAPDAIEYVDATPVPEPQAPAAEETANQEGTESPKTQSVPETTGVPEESAVPDASSGPEAALDVTAEPEVSPMPEMAGVPEKSAVPDASSEHETAPNVTAEPKTAVSPETKDKPEGDGEKEEMTETGAASKKKEAAGPLFGPMPDLPDEPVKGYVIIMVGSRQYGDPIPMDRDKIITIRQNEEKINRIHITRDSVYMESSTCANQDCVGEGEVTLENYKMRILGTYIVCLPNEVTVEMIPAETAEAQQ